MPITITPFIPQYITVHLGPPDSDAENVTVTFPDYIKNVASSEIYPTWDESAIRANIYAQISFALNRVYTEFYRSRGYDFDITNSTAIDQKFIKGRNIFDNIDRIVDEIFNDYIREIGVAEPLAAKYCNGTTVTCEGLSQWGSENLAQQGYSTLDILYYYYGYNIELVNDAPIREFRESYPGTPIRRGDSGAYVKVIQRELNLISQNYPLIPKINPVDGVFGENTEEAVRVFQEIFNLTPDGIVGKSTWYRLIYLYTGILRLNELDSEGQRLFGLNLEYPDAISEGNRGEKVTILQYFLSIFSSFDSTIPFVKIDGDFGPQTKNAVIAFQQKYDLTPDGIVGEKTWDKMYDVFKGTVDTVFLDEELFGIKTKPFGGTVLEFGSTGEAVLTLQQYLNIIALSYDTINAVTPTGNFGPQTRQAVLSFQKEFNLPQTGRVDMETWNAVANIYRTEVSALTSRPTQYPGKELRINDKDTL
ncbi:MAG: peptidoglycan-binding protein [Clostridia bacterium]|nr:peptidoglycan-binding protein [Clostridia bacterium]